MGAWSHMRLLLPLQVVRLQAFSKFDSTIDALAAATALVDSKLGKSKLLANRVASVDNICMANGCEAMTAKSRPGALLQT